MEVKDILRKRTNNPILNLDDAYFSISQKITKKLQSDILEGIPFCYLLESCEFYYHQFFINQDVLIPRPETEYLVDIIKNEFHGKIKRVLDVGTGSGVILLSLLSCGVGKSGVGVDISQKALDVSAINSKRLHLDQKIELLRSDRLDKVGGIFDLIVSNPPYIKLISHKKLVHSSVDLHEPHEALYLPDDFYRQWFEDFFSEIRFHLDGVFFMEGHELELESQKIQLESLGFESVQVIKDLSGTNRFLKASFHQKH